MTWPINGVTQPAYWTIQGTSVPVPSGRRSRPVKNGEFFLNEGYFSGKSLKLMPWFQIKMRLAVGTALPQTLRLESRGPTSTGKGGECARFRGLEAPGTIWTQLSLTEFPVISSSGKQIAYNNIQRQNHVFKVDLGYYDPSTEKN